MKRWQLSVGVRLWLVISLSGFLGFVFIQPGLAEKSANEENKSNSPTQQEKGSKILQLSEIELPATSAQMLAQSPIPTPTNPPSVQGGVVAITSIKANPTDKGVEVILETNQGDKLQVANRSAGNNFIADISGSQLRLASGEAFTFRSEKPIAGITEITVTNVDANTVRVTVVGEKALPAVELFDDNAGLIFAIASTTTAAQQPEKLPTEEKPQNSTQREGSTQQDDPIELVVTGQQDSYRVPNASTATRTDTPLRDIPQSIQVVPQEVLRDRNVRGLTEAVETVSSVVDSGDVYGSSASARTIRGFTSDGNFRNGYRDAPNTYILSSPIGTVEQVEVLKGPASVLFGALEPGGIVNVTTKQPLSEPYYNLGFEVGNRGFYQPSIDLSGPLTDDRSALYRFIASYQGAGGFQDFVETNQIAIAPSISLKLGDQTKLNLYYEYGKFSGNPPESFSLLLSNSRLTPRELYISYPDFASIDISAHRFGYTLTHELNKNWQIRNNFAGMISQTRDTGINPSAIADNRFVTLDVYNLDYGYNNYFAQIDVLGKFKTGSISHQLLFGLDFNDYTDNYRGLFNTNLPPLDILNPNYDVSEPNYDPFFQFKNQVQSYGLYLQDQIAFTNNLKLLIGGRYDWISSEYEIGDFGVLGNTTDEPVRNRGAFSPRIGLVYQPSDTISLYASYSRSFRQDTGFSSSDQDFEPTKGTQYEVGVKADWLDGKLSTTLAAYNLTKTNVVTTDPNNPQFSIQTGEQRSQGIELDVAGEILPGWKVIASYAYTDAKVTEDNNISVGNRLNNVPENQASLWTTYEIQKGNLRGLGFGLGFFYVGERQGDLSNSFQLDDYLRTDAALYYRGDGFKAAINVRNIFDTDYARSADGTTYIRRGAPFSITGSISWEF
jgi:iron complex outermembrane recepter protein